MAVTEFYATLTENSYNVSKNTSSVTAKVYITTTNSYNRLGTAKGTVTFSGNYSGSFNFSNTFTTYQTKCIYSKTFTVNHNNDGSGSVKISVRFDTRVSAGVVTATKSLTLHKIPRATTPKVTGTQELGKAVSISLPRAASGYTHTVTWSCAGQSGTVGTGLGTSASFTPPLSLANSITTASSAQCTLTTKTYSGSTLIGTTTYKFTLNVPSSMKPTISSVTVTDTTGYLTDYGAYIGGKSSVKVVTAASSVYGATIASYSVSLGTLTGTGATCNLGTPIAATLDEQQTLKVTVTDTRGRTASYSTNLRVVYYTYPDISQDTSIMRWNTTDNEEDDESTTLRVNVKGSVFNVDGGGTNTALIEIAHREFNATQWTEDESIIAGAVFDNTAYIANCDNTKRYEVRITVSDDFDTEYSITYTVATATPIIDLKANGKGAAFFGISRFDGLHFNGDVTLTSADGKGAALRGFSGQEEPYYLLHTYPQAGAPEMAPNLRVGGMQDDVTYEMKRINALELYWDAYLAGDIGFPLRIGAWSSGTVTVPDSMKYRMFLIFFGTSGSVYAPAVIAVKDWMNSTSGVITGIGGQTGVVSNANSQNIYSVNISYDEDSWTLNRASYVTHGTTSPYTHSTGQTRPIWQIRGLL